ncbi:MAG: CHRD domain-containing protein [Candidatus Rokuibacteriota bacterium]
MKQTTKSVLAAIGGGFLVFGTASLGSADERLRTHLHGYEEVPAVSTVASGDFSAKINRDGTIDYELSYGDLEDTVQQAHIHVGQFSVNGGISVFLCTNLGNGPAGTQACPAPPATITGTISADDVIGPTGQGVAGGEFQELVRAIRAGATYVNVHSAKFPGGEIRGQLDGSRRP